MLDTYPHIGFIRSIPLIAVIASWSAGCKLQSHRFDPPPPRTLFQDHWKGYEFDRVSAHYSLKLENPSSELSRRSGTTIPIVGGRPNVPKHVPDLPTVRPSLATVSLQYRAGAPAESVVKVTLRWPKPSTPSSSNEWTEETFQSPLHFDDVRDLIEDSGRLRCESRHPYYGEIDRQERVSRFNMGNRVKLRISGLNPDSVFDETVDYPQTRVLWRVAKRACPDLG